MFPGDAQFVPIQAEGGRVYVLKFSSSSDRHFVRWQPKLNLTAFLLYP
jgi:hypothetical protein